MAKWNDGLASYKHDATVAARDLFYGKDVIDKIKKAETENQIRIIMAEARKRRFGG